MNLRTPQEIVNSIDLNHQLLIQKIIDKIAENLNQNFKGEPIEIHIDQAMCVIRPIAKVLKIKLANKGWGITFGDERSSYQDTYVTATIEPLKPIISSGRSLDNSYLADDDERYEQQWER